jgi:hypothetical protein
MVELLLGLAITAVLMVAMGYAIHASIRSVEGNAQAIDVRRQANGGMEFMISTIRRAQVITPPIRPSDLKVDLPPDAHGNPTWAEFVLVGSDLMVKDQTTPSTGPLSGGVVLLSNVKTLTFATPGGKGAGDPPYKVIINMTVSVADTLSADPKRNLDVHLEATSVARVVLREQNAKTAK